MSFLYSTQIVTKRIVFSGTVTGTPTAQLYVNGVASGSPVNGSGSGTTWVFAVTIPSATVGDYIVIEASGVISGVTQYVEIVSGSIVEIEEPASGWPLTETQTENMIEILGLDMEPFVPPNIVIPPLENPEYSSGYLTALDKNVSPQLGTTFFLILEDGPGTEGYSYDRVRKQATSDEDGLVVFTNLVRGAKYRIWKGRDSSLGKTFIVPDEDSFELPEVV